MIVNMDGLRLQMTGAMNHLGRELLPLLAAMTDEDRDDIVAAFNSLASYIDNVNALYDDDNGLFNDVSDQAVVMDMYEALDE